MNWNEIKLSEMTLCQEMYQAPNLGTSNKTKLFVTTSCLTELQSTLALWTPRYYGHPNNTDSS